MIPCKRNSLGILCVEMLLSSETKFQIEENPTVIHEHKKLELNVTSIHVVTPMKTSQQRFVLLHIQLS